MLALSNVFTLSLPNLQSIRTIIPSVSYVLCDTEWEIIEVYKQRKLLQKRKKGDRPIT